MRIKTIDFDQTRRPSKVTVELSLDEVILIGQFVGNTTSIELEHILAGGHAIASEICDELIGGFLNVYWDGGLAEARKERTCPSCHQRGGHALECELRQCRHACCQTVFCEAKS